MNRNTHILYRILDSFFRYRWSFLIALFTVTGVTAAALLMRSRAYMATATTQVIKQDVAAMLGQDKNNGWISVAQQNVNHFNDLVKDDLPGGFLDAALGNAKLDRPINVDPRVHDPRFALLRQRLRANATSSNTFAIGLTWANPGECERIVQAIQQQYITERGLSRQAQSIATKSFLDSEIVKYEARMRTAEQALINYKLHNSGQLPEAQAATIDQLSKLTIQLNDLQISSHDGDLKRQALQQRIAQIKPMSIKEQTVGDSATAVQIKALEARRMATLADGWLATSDPVKAIDSHITTLKAAAEKEARANPALAKNILETKLQDNPEYQNLTQQLTDANIAQTTQKAQMDQVKQRIVEYEARIAQIPAAERDLTDKTRDYTILKAQYEKLLERREQAQLTASLDRVTASSTLSPLGVVYAQPTTSRTKKLLMIIGSLVLGMVVGIIIVILSELSDRSLRYAGDIERLLGVPILAVIPDTEGLRPLTPPALPGGKRARIAAKTPTTMARMTGTNSAPVMNASDS